MRLAGLLSFPAVTDSLTLYRRREGRRSEVTGRWEPGGFDRHPTKGAALPLDGEERLVLPEGSRTENIKRFLLPLEAVAVGLSSEGDVIEQGGKLFRVERVKKWKGFWEVIAVSPFEGELSVLFL